MIAALLSRTLDRAAAARWPLPLALAGQLLSLRLLRAIGARFAQETQGHPPFDFQNRLTRADIAAQLPAYTARSRALYRRFFAVDLVFPLVASAFLGMLWAALLRAAGPPLRRLRDWHAPAWPLLPTLFDWGENVCFLLLIERAPARPPALDRLAVLCKRLKLATLLLTFGGTALLLLAAGYRRLRPAPRP